ncbi:5'-methylthioadenosine/S-adenosylhomocysteine nucleosidase [Desulfobacterales bacterium HSG17]|nr:5'-methylthioadenosine/S-adenosylhomocysteine nucleosidase [Desulfobacterales bacterium HSG17]
MATMVEAKPFVSGMSLEPVSKKPFLVFKKEKIIVVICGIGKANAAMATAYCCTKFKPDTVLNIGAAGALTKTKKRGEIYHINKIIEHDRLDFKTDKPFIHNSSMMKGFKCAILSTSDNAAVSKKLRKEVAAYGGELVDMEGASIVQTCKKFKTPCYLFKYVSDTHEDDEEQSIIDNIREYRQKSFVFFEDKIYDRL